VATRVRALAELGNARRIAGDAEAAERALGAAFTLYRTGGTDPLQGAELRSLLASLRAFQRRFREARSLVRAATRIYGKLEDRPAVARQLVQLAHVHALEGRPHRGIAVLTEVFERLIDEADPALRLYAVENLVLLWLEAGEPAEAAELVRAARPVFDLARAPIGDLDRLRFDWLAARVDLELGRPSAAAVLLARVRRGFLAEGLPYEVALVGLDLAAVLAQLRRSDEQRALAAETVELLTRLGVEREALAAAALLASTDASVVRAALPRLGAAIEAARRAAAQRAAAG
jgi:hypothetical protein